MAKCYAFVAGLTRGLQVFPRGSISEMLEVSLYWGAWHDGTASRDSRD